MTRDQEELSQIQSQEPLHREQEEQLQEEPPLTGDLQQQVLIKLNLQDQEDNELQEMALQIQDVEVMARIEQKAEEWHMVEEQVIKRVNL